MDDFIDFFGGAFLAILLAIMVVFLGSMPIIIWKSAGIMSQQLNKQCGTNYRQMDVFITGDSLTELCRMENQKLEIK